MRGQRSSAWELILYYAAFISPGIVEWRGNMLFTKPPEYYTNSYIKEGPVSVFFGPKEGGTTSLAGN